MAVKILIRNKQCMLH